LRGHGALDVAVLRVLRDPDDLDLQLRVRPAADADAPSDGVLRQVELARERLVDDGDLWRAEGVTVRELPPGHERNAHGAEETWSDAVERRAVVGIRAGVEAFDPEAVVPVVAREDGHHGVDGARHARNGSQLG